MKLGPNQTAYHEDLRYGGRKQTRHYLECEGAYCALGVACVALEGPKVKCRRRIDSDVLSGTSLSTHKEVAEALAVHTGSICPMADGPRGRDLVDHVAKLCKQPVGDVPDYVSDCSVITMNDNYHLTFTEIADVLDEFSDLYYDEPR